MKTLVINSERLGRKLVLYETPEAGEKIGVKQDGY
jgi:hypothetical protein